MEINDGIKRAGRYAPLFLFCQLMSYLFGVRYTKFYLFGYTKNKQKTNKN